MTWEFRRVPIEDVGMLLSAGWERACPVWFLAQGGEVVWTWLRRPADAPSAREGLHAATPATRLPFQAISPERVPATDRNNPQQAQHHG